MLNRERIISATHRRCRLPVEASLPRPREAGRGLNCRLLILATIAVVVCPAIQLAAQLRIQAPGLSPSEIVRIEVVPRLQAWKRKFSGLRMQYREVRTDERGKPFDRTVIRIDWKYGGDHESWYHRRVEENGDVRSRLLEIVNRERSDVIVYPEGESDLEHPLEVRALQIPSHRSHGILPMRGLWLGERDQWLPELLAEVPVSDLEWGMLDRFRCLELPIASVFREDGHWYLDPKIDYLPRGYRDERETYVVEEFRDVPPGVLMPWKGRFEVRGPQAEKGTTYYHWEVESLVLNPKFEPGAFDVPSSSSFIGELIDGFSFDSTTPEAAYGGYAVENPHNGEWMNGITRSPRRWGTAAVLLTTIVGGGLAWRRRFRQPRRG
ncbi:MAG: hypothetical protein WD065_06750 [Planctomycetaceae bacterium]